MSPYRKFSDSFRGNGSRGVIPAKAAKPAKANPAAVGTLAELATLASGKAGNDVSATCAEPTPPASDSAAVIWGDAEEERAAIIEHKAGIPHAWAEGFARLDADSPPADVPPQRWRQFVDDTGLFLDAGWAAKAAALGWGPLDLFGCNRERPFARIDHAGLCWLINSNKLVALSESAAFIETRTGVRQTYRRKPVSDGETALAWELKNERSASAIDSMRLS